MNKPYTTCYMMTSVDGRIDCQMTVHLPGDEYYPILAEQNFDAAVSGRVPAQLEMSLPGEFKCDSATKLNQEIVLKKADKGPGYDVVVDTKGKFLWNPADQYGNPIIIVTSLQASQEYLDYLDSLGISYIAAGEKEIDLVRVSEILKDTFGVETMGIVGGATINTAFLDAGLLDEVHLLVGAGIDGRASYPPVFNRHDDKLNVTQLKLLGVETFNSGAVLLKYQVLNGT